MAYGILVSAQVLLVLTLGLWTLDLGLTIFFDVSRLYNIILEKRPSNNNNLEKQPGQFLTF